MSQEAYPESNDDGASSSVPLVDIGWNYVFRYVPDNKDKWKCKLCGHQASGGVNRAKQHIAGVKGGVKSCTKASDEAKQLCKESLDLARTKKGTKSEKNASIREDVDIIEVDNMERDVGNKRPRSLGPMDKHVSQIKVDDDITFPSKNARQQSIHDALSKERSHQVHQYLARWVYESGIAFNQVDNDSFRRFLEAVGQFGPGYQPPSQYQLREPLLKEEVDRTKKLLKDQEEEWGKNGCSIMTDAWSDRCRRSIMNLCVNSRLGTAFISSKEASNDSHTGKYIFEYVDECVEIVGEKNVVQVVTDNASNNMAAAELLLAKRPKIFWTSCATHTINLMLEGIGKLAPFKNTIAKAKSFTIFMYSHTKTLALMRRMTNREIVRPGVTRFATAFLTLQSLMEKRDALRAMVVHPEWYASKWSKSKKGKEAIATMIQPSFWSGVGTCLKVFEPLVKVLRLVDGDEKPAMAFVYGELRNAKNNIKVAMKNDVSKYGPILKIVESKGKTRLDTHLHLTSYLLNPYYYYKESSTWSDDERELIMNGFYDCIERLIPDYEESSHVVNVELQKYMRKEGTFGRAFALKGCEDYNFDPVDWWERYGIQTPKLKKVAMRILALTTSSSGCERTWSAFEGIHTKKRNRLDTQRMNKLVYVQFNARLRNKKKKKKDNIDVLLANSSHHAQTWLVEGLDDEEVIPGSGLTYRVVSEASGANEVLQPRRSSRNVADLEEDEIREVDEIDFVSDDSESTEGEDDDEVEDFDLDSDKELNNVVGEDVEDLDNEEWE